MKTYTEEQRATARRSIVEFGIPAFMCEGQAEPALIAAWEQERKQLVAAGTAKCVPAPKPKIPLVAKPAAVEQPAAKAAQPKTKRKYRSALHRVVATHITAGPPPAQPDDSDQRNSDGEFGDWRDVFALPLGEDPIWMKRRFEAIRLQREAEEDAKRARERPEPEFIPSPEAEEAPAAEEVQIDIEDYLRPADDEPEAACAAYIRTLDEQIDIEEPRDEELPAPPPEPDEPPQEVLDRVWLDEIALDAFKEKRGENDHPDDPITFSTRVPEQPLRAFLASAEIAVTDSKLGQRRLQALSAIIGSALVAAEAGQWVSYSRRRKHYSERHMYEGQAYTYDCIVPAVDELSVGSRWLVNDKAKGGDDMTTGLQSRFRATDALRKAFDGVEISEAGLYNPIRLTDDDGVIVPFKHTRETTLLLREMTGLNRYFNTMTIELPGVERTKHHHIVDGQHVRLSSKPQVVRIFGRKRWDRHGRLYGPWQNLPKKYRLNLLINGMECMELDFSSLHPTILYALRGNVLDRDPYAVPGYETMRAACKIALNVAINARSRAQAVSALMQRRTLTGDKRWVLSRAATTALLDAVIAHNAPIADAICSDAGVGLMYTDSRIMIEILKAAEAAGIPALPVHDSVIVPVKHEAQMRAIMTASYKSVVSPLSDCFIKGSFKKIPQMVEGGGAGVSAPVASGSRVDDLGSLVVLVVGGASGTSASGGASGSTSVPSVTSSVAASPVVSRPSLPRRSYVLVTRGPRAAYRGLSRIVTARSSSLSRRSIHAASWDAARRSAKPQRGQTSQGSINPNLARKINDLEWKSS